MQPVRRLLLTLSVTFATTEKPLQKTDQDADEAGGRGQAGTVDTDV